MADGIFFTRDMNRVFLYPLLVFVFLALILNHSPAAAASAENTPWSGYWWPYRTGGLATGLDYRGHPAPIEKYEMLTTGYTRGPVLSWYKNRYYDPDAEPWEGLCTYWAKAAILENYEILPSSEENIVFRVGDKKGLLTLCHDQGKAADSGHGADPTTFHFWLINYLGNQGRAFIADLGSDGEIWYYPIYRYEMRSTTSGSTQSVEVTVYYASDAVDPDYIGTSTRPQTYTYDLEKSGGQITGGQWTGDSRSNHPGWMVLPESAGTGCEDLDCQRLRSVAQSRDDYLEKPDNSIVDLSPGTYHLVLLDKDTYRLDCDPEDEIDLKLTKAPGSEAAIEFLITDKDNGVSVSESLTGQTEKSYHFTAENPPYRIELTQANYETDPNIYTLILDMDKAHQQLVPYIPKNGMWSGFALSNTGDEAAVENIHLVACDASGNPVQTLLGPADLAPGHKRHFLFEELPWRRHEYKDIEFLRVMADEAVTLINNYAFPGEPMGGFGRSPEPAGKLVIPELYPSGRTRLMAARVVNESFDAAEAALKAHSSAGAMVEETMETVPARGAIDIRPGFTVTDSVDDGWILVEGADGAMLTGYLRQTDESGRKNENTAIFALKADRSHKIVPHITPPLGWWETELTLINPGGYENRVRLHLNRAGEDTGMDLNLALAPHEKRRINLTDEFGVTGGKLAYSILELQADLPIAGYYSYYPPYGNDQASFPLMDTDDLGSRISLGHYAGQGRYFWTSICVFNAGTEPAAVALEACDAAGEELELQADSIELAPGAYDTFTVRSRLASEVADKLSLLKLSAAPDQRIGGFFLYGNMKDGVVGTDMVSGAAMEPIP